MTDDVAALVTLSAVPWPSVYFCKPTSMAVANVGIAKRIGAAGRPGHINPVALPLVADRTQPIGIRQRVRRRQNLALLRPSRLIVTDPVGASLTLLTAAVEALVTASAVP